MTLYIPAVDHRWTPETELAMTMMTSVPIVLKKKRKIVFQKSMAKSDEIVLDFFFEKCLIFGSSTQTLRNISSVCLFFNKALAFLNALHQTQR